MKISKTLAPAVVLLSFGVGVGTAFLISQRAATAETSAPQAAKLELRVDASGVSTFCEDREVEMDEGYALTRKEKRRVCH
jgi:hypothetical protein